MIVETGCVKVEIIRFVDDHFPGIIEFKLTDACGRNWYFIEKVPIVCSHNLDYEDSYPQPGWLPCAVIERFADGTGRNIVRIDTEYSLEGEHVFSVLADQMEHPIETLERVESTNAPPRDYSGGPHPVEFHFQQFLDKRSMFSHIGEQNIADVIEEGDAISWGCFALPNSRVIVVGFNQSSFTPQGMIFDGYLYIGIGAFCACYELASASRCFIYGMPTLFHEFIRFSPWLIVRDDRFYRS